MVRPGNKIMPATIAMPCMELFYEGGACRLTEEQQHKLKAWITETLPQTTREVGAWIEQECRIEYQGRSGLIALLHRLDMEHR